MGPFRSDPVIGPVPVNLRFNALSIGLVQCIDIKYICGPSYLSRQVLVHLNPVRIFYLSQSPRNLNFAPFSRTCMSLFFSVSHPPFPERPTLLLGSSSKQGQLATTTLLPTLSERKAASPVVCPSPASLDSHLASKN